MDPDFGRSPLEVAPLPFNSPINDCRSGCNMTFKPLNKHNNWGLLEGEGGRTRQKHELPELYARSVPASCIACVCIEILTLHGSLATASSLARSILNQALI